MNPEDAWALFRQQFGNRSEYILSVVPWGGDRAVVITTDGVYLAEFDDAMGYRLVKHIER